MVLYWILRENLENSHYKLILVYEKYLRQSEDNLENNVEGLERSKFEEFVETGFEGLKVLEFWKRECYRVSKSKSWISTIPWQVIQFS